MTQPKICRHCNEPFVPDLRNRTRQDYCSKPECRKARKVKSQQLWLAKNPTHFKGSENVVRVQQWRHAHPQYWRRSSGSRTPPESVKQDSRRRPPLQDRLLALQDSVARNPLIIGLIAHIFGSTLQDDIEGHMRRLIIAGMEIFSSTTTPKNRPSTNLALGTNRPVSPLSSSAFKPPEYSSGD